MKVHIAVSRHGEQCEVLQVFARREDADAFELANDVLEFDVTEGSADVRTYYWLTQGLLRPEHGGSWMEDALQEERRLFEGDPNTVHVEWRHLRSVQREWWLRIGGWDLGLVERALAEQRAQHPNGLGEEEPSRRTSSISYPQADKGTSA